MKTQKKVAYRFLFRLLTANVVKNQYNNASSLNFCNFADRIQD